MSPQHALWGHRLESLGSDAPGASLPYWLNSGLRPETLLLHSAPVLAREVEGREIRFCRLASVQDRRRSAHTTMKDFGTYVGRWNCLGVPRCTRFHCALARLDVDQMGASTLLPMSPWRSTKGLGTEGLTNF